jgi:hypothetical protein
MLVGLNLRPTDISTEHRRRLRSRDDFKKYQVEIETLEKTEEYVHVAVSVDDGHLPASICPATDSFIQKKPSSSA